MISQNILFRQKQIRILTPPFWLALASQLCSYWAFTKILEKPRRYELCGVNTEQSGCLEDLHKRKWQMVSAKAIKYIHVRQCVLSVTGSPKLVVTEMKYRS